MRVKFMVFRNYERSQELKMKFIAENSRGFVLDIGGSQNPNKYFDMIKNVREVWLLDIIEPKLPLPRKYTRFVKFDLERVHKEPLTFQ